MEWRRYLHIQVLNRYETPLAGVRPSTFAISVVLHFRHCLRSIYDGRAWPERSISARKRQPERFIVLRTVRYTGFSNIAELVFRAEKYIIRTARADYDGPAGFH